MPPVLASEALRCPGNIDADVAEFSIDYETLVNGSIGILSCLETNHQRSMPCLLSCLCSIQPAEFGNGEVNCHSV